MPRRKFGEISEIKSRVAGRPPRFRVRYIGPDGQRHKAPSTFEFRGDAEGFLRTTEQEIYLGVWQPPGDAADAPAKAKPDVLTFAAYAEQCIAQREARARKPIRPTTAALYRKLMRLELSPTFGAKAITAITAADVKRWYAESSAANRPTQTGNAYLFLKSVFTDAIDEGLIDISPCRVKGGGKPDRARQVVALSTSELATYLEAVPEAYRAPLALAGWCGLRSGKVRALRVGDYDRDTGRLRVEQAVNRVDGKALIGRPKTEAGMRSVYVPPHVRPMLVAWLNALPVRGKDALMFTARDGESPLNSSVLREAHAKGAEAIGRPGMTVHDLRRTAATMAAQQGATMSEVMRMLGHTTTTVAALYQSAADERMEAIAKRMSGAGQ